MNAKRDHRDALLRLADALNKDLLDASDEEIIADAKAEGVDLEAFAEASRAAFEKVAAAVGRQRLIDAKAAVAAQRPPAPVVKLDPAAARRRLDERLKRDHPDAAAKLTLAARNGQTLSDDDVLGMLAELDELDGLGDGTDRRD